MRFTNHRVASLLFTMGLVISFSGCVNGYVGFMGPSNWTYKDQFVGVDEDEPHGIVRIARSHQGVFALFDDQHIFVDRETGEIILRVRPGMHTFEAAYIGGWEATGDFPNARFIRVLNGVGLFIEVSVVHPPDEDGYLIVREQPYELNPPTSEGKPNSI